MSQQVVLLTAAVTPSPLVPFTALNSMQRLGLYRAAFTNWREITAATGMRLCIVETTGATADELGLESAERELFVQHEPNPALEPLGKGALESSALDAGMGFIAGQLGTAVTVHKVTGKLHIPNWKRVLHVQEPNTLRIRRSMDRSTCDTRIFSTTAGTWLNHFAGISDLTNDNDGVYFEHVVGYRSILAEFKDPNFLVEQFPTPPKIVGVSGSDGNKYGGFTKDGLSNVLAHIERPVLPHFRKRMI